MDGVGGIGICTQVTAVRLPTRDCRLVIADQWLLKAIADSDWWAGFGNPREGETQ